MDLSMLQWVDLMGRMAWFVKELHEKEMVLGVPIERCMYVEYCAKERRAKPVFFYFQPF
jgi:hypothetical protein